MSCFSSTPRYIYRCDLLYSSRRQSSSFRFRLASGANATSHHSGIWQVFRSKRCNEPRSREPPLRISPPPTSSNMSENQQECDRRPPTPPFLEFLISLSISQRYTSPSTSASFWTEAWHLHLSFAWWDCSKHNLESKRQTVGFRGRIRKQGCWPSYRECVFMTITNYKFQARFLGKNINTSPAETPQSITKWSYS